MTQKRLLSGIQPTGQLMIGNYIGAMKHWVEMQATHECLYALVDLHAITVKQDPKEFRAKCYDMLSMYLACGIDPEKSALFLQSHVPAHSQLAWVLNCFSSMGELSRMTQYKDKSQRHSSNINVGLFSYPVLQAADILLYNTDIVPVGSDQKQHLELTRDIAMRFNHQYSNVFTIPEPYIATSGARIMSLQDPSKKMSKSDENTNSFIALLDNADVIRKKFKRAVTDSDTEIRFDAENKPGVSNLLTLQSCITGQSIDTIEKSYAGEGYGRLKTGVAEAVIEHITPIQERYQAIRHDTDLLSRVLSQGAEKAASIATPMMQKIYDIIGFIGK